MWIFRVKWPPGSPPAFKARYVVLGFSQRQGVDFFQTFSPTPKITTLRLLLHVAAQRDYELHSLDFSTAFLQGSLHEEIWLRHPPGFTGSFPAGTKWSLRWPVYVLRQASRGWHVTLRSTLEALGFSPSTADPSLFLRTDTALPPFYVLVHVDDLIFATADIETQALVKSELQKRHTCTDLGELRDYLGLQITRDKARRTITLTQSHMVHQVLQRFGFLVLRYFCSTSGMGLVLGGWGPVVLTGHADASKVDDLATQRLSQGYTFSLGSGSVSWWFTRSSSVLISSCEVEIYAGAMAAQELRWPTYLVTDLGERPCSSSVLYVDKKVVIAFCQEHRTKHISLHYFLAQDLQQRGLLRLAYETTRANTADLFTKALPPGAHLRFCTVLGLGAAPSGVSQVDPVEPVEVAVDSRPAAGAEPGGAESGGAVPGGAEPGGAESGGAVPGGAEPGGAESGGAVPGSAEPGGAESGGPESGGPVPESPTPGGALSSEQLREWYLQYCRLRRGTSGVGRTTGAGAGTSPPRRELPSRDQIRAWYERRCTLRSGAPGVTDPGATGTTAGAEEPGAGAATGAVEPGVGAAAGAGDPRVGAAAGAEDPGVGAATGAEDPGAGTAAGAEDPGVGAAAGAEDPGTGDSARRQPSFVPLLQQVLGLPSSTGPPPPIECPQPVPSQLQFQPASPLPAPSPYTCPTGGLAERREPASRPASPVRAARTSGRGSRQHPPPVPGTHRMSLRPSTAPLRAPLPPPPESSLPTLSDPESDFLRAASPTVTRLLATVVTDPSSESTAASTLVAELVDFAACCRLDYAASLVAESESVCPPSVGGVCAVGTDVLEDRQEEFQCLAAASPHLVSVLLTPEGDPDALDILTPPSYAEAIEGPYSSQWQAAMDAEMASWKSTGTYIDAVPPPGANIVSGMWIFRVKRPPGSPPVFKARYVARGFSQRHGVDYFQTFSPTPKMTTLWVLLHVAAHRDYELHSLDFSTAFLQGSLHEEIWLRRPLGFTGTFPPGTQWSLWRPVYGLRQAPREWNDTLRTTLAALGFAPSTADPSLFLRTDTSLPPFYILVYVDDLVFATADTTGLAYVKSELQKRHTCTDLGELRSYLGLQITRDRARRTITLTQSHMVQQVLQRFGFTYSSPQATPLPTRHSLSALPSDESVEPSGPYPELVGCLMYLMTCTRPDLAYPLSILARYVAPGRHRPEHMTAAKRVLRYLCSTSGMGLVLGGQSPVVLTGHADASWADDQTTQRSSQGYTFSLGSGSVSWRATRSSSVLGSNCEAEIYAGAMAAQELRWLTYLLTDLGEPPRSPPVLYVDNKAMLALCREQRLEHRTKHIALCYFLARELQQRGQLRLAYVASEANTADVFTKALAPCDHQRFCTQLGLVSILPHLLTS
ncbi:unnamed protein product [Closterium sp. NIES-54]